MSKTKQLGLPINKYGNIRIYYDLANDIVINKQAYDGLTKIERTDALCFDSILEFEVYKILRSRFHKKAITHHFTMNILPRESDKIKAINWCVDFCIAPNDGTELFFVEAKGVETDDYSMRQNLLARFKPLICDRVMVVKKEDLHRFAHRINTWELWKDEESYTAY